MDEKNQEDFRKNVRLILRQILLQNCGICFDHLESLEKLNEENPSLLFEFIQEIHSFHQIIFLCSENPLPSKLLDLSTIYPVKLSELDQKAQKEIWKMSLNGNLKDSEKTLFPQLISSFNLTGGQIAQAVRYAQQSAVLRDPENVKLVMSDIFTPKNQS